MNFIDCISLQEAIKIIRSHIKCVADVESVSLVESLSRIAADDVLAGENLPPFRRSTVDGYAVNSADTFGAEEGIPALLTIAGEILMGQASTSSLQAGQAWIIPTGGMLPDGADAVVMVEYTELFDKDSVLIAKKAAPGENVIQQGEDVSSEQIILHRGQLIRYQDIGLLAACGQTRVTVRKKIRVGIVSTGDEIVDIDLTPGPGQVRNINSYVLQAMVTSLGCEVKSYGIVPDCYEQLVDTMNKAAAECNLVLLSGGSSMGGRDYSVRVIDNLGRPGVLFHGIAVKPGKPTIFGMADSVPVFGLPGHPAAAMTMFQRLVKPVISILAGQLEQRILLVPAQINRNIASAPGRDDFISVRLQKHEDGYWAEPVFGRSGLISIMTQADGVVHIPAAVSGLYAGDKIDVEIFSLGL